MSAGYLVLRIERGEELDVLITYEPGGSPVSVAGWSATFRLGDETGVVAEVTQVSSDAGQIFLDDGAVVGAIRVHLTPATTSVLSGKSQHELWLQDVSGDPHRLLFGVVEVRLGLGSGV